MKSALKNVLATLAPRSTAALLSARARAHSHRVIASWGTATLNRKLLERFGNRVREGPFAGLSLTPMTHAEQIGPFLLGVYESELDEAWERIFRGSYTQFLDMGAKFGYYAVGLARKFPATPVVAFDTDWWARKAIREMAAANDTPRIEVRDFCSPAWIARYAHEAAFLISDCEGYEADLFTPAVIARLHSATLLIETHDAVVPGVSDRLTVAFQATHSVQRYGPERGRRNTPLPLGFLSERERELAVQEVRQTPLWLVCLPRTGPNKTSLPRESAS